MDTTPISMAAIRQAVKDALAAQLRDDALLKDTDAAAMLGRSRAKFRDQVKKGELPPPVRDGNMTRWRKSELLAVIERLANERDEVAA